MTLFCYTHPFPGALLFVSSLVILNSHSWNGCDCRKSKRTHCCMELRSVRRRTIQTRTRGSTAAQTPSQRSRFHLAHLLWLQHLLRMLRMLRMLRIRTAKRRRSLLRWENLHLEPGCQLQRQRQQSQRRNSRLCLRAHALQLLLLRLLRLLLLWRQAQTAELCLQRPRHERKHNSSGSNPTIRWTLSKRS